MCIDFAQLFLQIENEKIKKKLRLEMLIKWPKCFELYQDIKDLVELFSF